MRPGIVIFDHDANGSTGIDGSIDIRELPKDELGVVERHMRKYRICQGRLQGEKQKTRIKTGGPIIVKKCRGHLARAGGGDDAKRIYWWRVEGRAL